MTRTVVAAVLLAGALAASGSARPSISGTSPPPILFAADNEPALSGDIFRLDAGGRLVNLTHSPFLDQYPSVSPDGRRVAFESDRSGAPGLYVVGVDGAGQRRLDPPPHEIGSGSLEPQLAWSPNSEVVAAVTGISGGTLRLLRPGRAPMVVTRDRNFLFGPRWSPDGCLITVERGLEGDRVVSAYTAAGKGVWQVPYSLDVPGWSRHGLFAVIGTRGLRVYDERGRKQFATRARAAAWAPDGMRIADVVKGVLEIRTPTGRVFLRTQLRGLHRQRVTLAWIDSRHVLVGFYTRGFYPRVVGLDTGTGGTFAGSPRYFAEPRSPDGRLLAETVRHGSTFAVETSVLPHGRSRVYGHVGGCLDDGSLEAALTSLQFVPGRRSLVYQSSCPEPLASLYAVNPDGGGLTRVTHDGKHDTQPAWSPDGTRIAYTRYDAVGSSCKGCPGSLVVASADGSSPHVLDTPTGDDYADAGPSWSPDGTQIVFSRVNFSKPAELFVMPAAGGAPRDLHLSGFEAAWGPTRIAYIEDAREPISLWTARPDGSDPQKVANVPATEISPSSLAWSADGRLAYAEPQSGGILVFSGTAEHHVAVPFRDLRSIDWSPDGTRFVVVARAKGGATYDVYSLRTDGTDVRRLTTNVDAYGGSWR
jgi:Tol biopolymer transport system component